MEIISLLEEVTTQPKDFDWIKTDQSKRWFISPKRTSISGFEDALGKIIPLKLEEAMKRQKQLEKEQKERQKIIKTLVLSKHQDFWKELDIAWFEEYFVIEKWIRYWLHLNDALPDAWKEVANNHEDKINEEDIVRAKNFPIEDLYIGTLRKAGTRLIGTCPFHDETTPSFFIFPDNSWWCFGACSEGGDSISFKMKLDEINFIEAVKRLR